MGYRVDERVRCEHCEAVLAEGEGAYGADGRLLCRGCHSTTLIQRADAAALREQTRGMSLGLGSPSGAERPAWWGWALMSPAPFFGLVSLALWTAHELSGGSCSELGCLGIALAAMAGVVVGVPSSLLGFIVLPARLRGWGLWVCAAALLASVAPLFALR